MKKRIEWIDICKGIGILLVIIGHAPRNEMRLEFTSINFIYTFIYSFHMSLFFILSGITYSIEKGEKNLKQFVFKNIKTILIPFMFYSIFIYLIILIFNMFPSIKEILSGTDMSLIPLNTYLIDMIKCSNPYAFHLWFLLILFIIKISYFFLEKYFLKKSKIKHILFAILLILIYSFGFKIKTIIYLIRNFYYFILGVMIYKFLNNDLKQYKYLSYLGVVGILIISFVKMSKYSFGLFYKEVQLLSLFVFAPLVCIFIINITKKIVTTKIAFKLRFLGINSYNIYLLHQPFCCGFVGFLLMKIFPNTYLLFILIMLICSLLSVFIPLFIVKILYMTKLEKFTCKIFNIKKLNI